MAPSTSTATDASGERTSASIDEPASLSSSLTASASPAKSRTSTEPPASRKSATPSSATDASRTESKTSTQAARPSSTMAARPAKPSHSDRSSPRATDSCRLGQLVRRPVLQERVADERAEQLAPGPPRLTIVDAARRRACCTATFRAAWPRIAQSGCNRAATLLSSLGNVCLRTVSPRGSQWYPLGLLTPTG